MKIINIVPGFGGTFYCGNCLRDSGFVSALRQAGADAMILPVYLPLTIKGNMQTDTPVFYGAVNIYLKQVFPIMQHMPAWMEHLLNSAPLLKFAASKAGSTRAHGLEELTESMLMGKEGRQGRELDELVHFLKHHEKPDIVHFSNALLLGMAVQIKEEVGVPVVCSLQDEDVWVDAMKEPHREKIWNLLSEKAKDVDAFIPVSRYFSQLMQHKMKIPDEKLHLIPIGINPSLYEFHPLPPATPAIGYLSRICEENGFGILTDAFIKLRSQPGFENVKLHVTGGMTGDDKPFVNRQLKKLQNAGLEQEVLIFENFGLVELGNFFKSVSVLSVPVLKGEAFGLYQLEALASGVPLVQPALGAFPEIIKETGGGLIYEPNTPEALCGCLASILNDKAGLQRLSERGRKSVETKFDCGSLTAKMLEVYKKIL
ncbi:MAG: glycosyltransferase family 4 protein [Bacteroidetes bacterium]|nr:glycosyltransferase family 4 protein [Bacteroidota bacterium]